MVKITADAAQDFLTNGARKFGKGRMGRTTLKPAATHAITDGKITKLTFTLDTDSDYAEPGSGKPDPANKKVIKLIAALAKEHEDNAIKYANDALRSWNPKVQADALMDRSFKNKADAIKAIDAKLAELKKALLDACLDLHRKEGLIDLEQNKDGTLDVFTKPEGASGCK